MRKNFLITLGVVAGMVAVMRLLPHPWNFAPVGALAIFAGMYMPKRWAIVAPLVAVFISDLIVGLYDWQVMVAVYACYAVAVLIGRYLTNRKKYVVVGSLAFSVVFFLITNLAVFFMWYPHSWAGLVNCYMLAFPFFRNSVLGDLFYSVVLVYGFELSKLIYKKSITKQKYATN